MPTEVLNVFMRWLHISSAAILVGGFVFGRLVLSASAKTLAADASQALADRTAALFRPLAIAAMISLVVSGIYNLLYSPGHTLRYEILLIVKLLFAAHIFSTAILVVRPGHPRRRRLMTGAAISGLVVIAISEFLRRTY
jgi:uncharacterized membrane protein